MRQHCAAFAGGELLVGIKAEDGQVAKAAGALALELGADGLAGVLDHDQIMAAGEARSASISAGMPKVWTTRMARVRGVMARSTAAGIEVECHGVDLRKDWRGADLENRVGHGDKSEGGHDDLVALADAQRKQSEMQTGGAGADGYGVGHGVIGGQRGFKGRKLGAEAEVRRAQNGGDGIDFGLGDVRR